LSVVPPAGTEPAAPSIEPVRLPANAYTPLRSGERYVPLVAPDASPPEASWRAIGWGLTLCVVFTLASAYSGLKVGQVMEAAIPISILAIGLARVYRRRSTLLENVILTGIGGTSGAVVAGAIFTLPALYTLQLNPHPVQTILICLAGGCLGVLFLIPLRRYFVREMHGQFPYPEATAITEVLVTGERGGSQAKLLLQATALAGVYDFFVTTFHVWREFVDLRFLPSSDRWPCARGRRRLRRGRFILGLGYVMGLRSSMVLVRRRVLSNVVLVPLIWMVGQHLAPDTVVYPATVPIAEMTAAQIFRGYVRFIGVGAIATAGIFGIIKSLRIVAGSFAIAARAFRHGEASDERTDRDIPVAAQLAGVVGGALVVAIFFGSLSPPLGHMVLALGLTLVFSFFFTSVAANAIATTARNPVSGMTMLTIIISSLVLLRFGVSGESGMFFVMAIAGMVCTALSVSGQTITDLKTGYWLGSTPAVQERVKFLGVVAAAIAAGLAIVVLAQAFQFGEAAPGDTRAVLAAPQASIMQALVQGFMDRSRSPGSSSASAPSSPS
jgi:putative OPT family oligopeptide transporter